MTLKIRTLNGSVIVKKPPNGGWGWVVTLSAFFCGGIAFGSTKSFGVFFIDIKNEFGASNASTSWFMSIFVSVLTVSGIIPHILSKWMDARQMAMFGGLIGSTGLVVCAFSPVMALMYLGAVITGVGYGIITVCSLSQVSLYFSSFKPLANGIALSGYTLLGTAYPYLNQYLLDLYNWRDAFLILAALNLNACCAGALIHPISPCKDDSVSTETDDDKTIKCSLPQSEFSKTVEDKNRVAGFLKNYWLGMCLLLVHSCIGLSMYVPNVYIVPHALTSDISSIHSTVLLSVISFGDFLGCLLAGAVLSKFKNLKKRILLLVAFLIFSCSAVQIIPILGRQLPELIVYALLYGGTFGSMATSSITAISQFVEPEIMTLSIGLYFACGGVAVFASGILSGLLVDCYGTFLVVFWYALICMALAGIMMMLCTFAVYRRGGRVVK